MDDRTAMRAHDGAGQGGQGLEGRIDAILARIDAAAERAGRAPADVTILLATKTRTADEILAAVTALRERGRRVAVGENRMQEAAKHEDPRLLALDIPRHVIGRLQTNKAKDAVAFASVIHSVDRDDLIEALERRCALADVQRDVMVQVNTSGEESKAGYAHDIEAVRGALERIRATERLRCIGLMTIGANTAEETAVRASLSRLRELRDELGEVEVRELSMGMSGDLEIAVEEGATIVRLGSAVFGPREA